jgi:hypothetical protein
VEEIEFLVDFVILEIQTNYKNLIWKKKLVECVHICANGLGYLSTYNRYQ